MGLELSLTNQLITLCAQLAYVYAFRGAFERQAAVLRRRPLASLGLGFAICAFWAALGFGAFHLAAAHASASLLVVLSVPLYLAIAAGGSVCLAALASRAFGWSVERHAFRCVIAGQVVAVIAGAVPKFGPLLVSLYACSGIGAIALAELTVPHDDEAPRLGKAGLIAMAVLTVALSLGLWRAGSRLNAAATDLAVPVSSADWSSKSQGR
jgi:hypothetical protein